MHGHPPTFEKPELAITEANIAHLVHSFYGRVRADPLLSPIFDAQVHDWPEHLHTLTSFWSWLLLKKPGFHGSPIPKHMRLEGLSWAHFERWLALFRQTTSEMQLPPLQSVVDAMAQSIATTLWANYQQHHPASPWVHEVPKDLVSYKVSPVFTQENVPVALQSTHSTKAGTWGVLRVFSGALIFTVDEQPPRTTLLREGDQLLIPPQQPHRVSFVGDGSFVVDFHKKRAL